MTKVKKVDLKGNKKKQNDEFIEQHLTNEFYLNELREHSRRLFGIKPEVIDGALFNIKGNQITKSQVERYIRLFLTREAN